MSTGTKLTLEEFLALPETKPGSKYVDGEVVQRTMSSTDHTIIQRLLSFVFTVFLRQFPIADGGTEGAASSARTGTSWRGSPTSRSCCESDCTALAVMSRSAALLTSPSRSCHPTTA